MKDYNQIELLDKILSIKSVNGSDNEKILAIYLYEYFRAHGVQAKIQDIDEHHANIIAWIEGESAETVIWNGHLDTVPYGAREEWNSNPEIPAHHNGCIYARGASDMKSGLAAMAYTLVQIQKTGKKPRRTIWFAGTCDEEKNGLGAQELIKAGEMPAGSLLLIGEPTGGKIGIAQKGCLWICLHLSGKTSHGAYPEEGVNAIEYGVRAAQELGQWIHSFSHPMLGSATAQITMANGGIAPNMTPDHAEILMDIRLLPGMETDIIIKKLEEICSTYQQALPGKMKYWIEKKNERIPIETEPGSIWAGRLKASLEQCGLQGEAIGISYFTDASILVQEEAYMPVFLCGPGEPHLAHKPNEYVEVEKYLAYIEMLVHLFGIDAR